MNEELERILKLQDKKWQIIYAFTDNGSVFINQKQYDQFLKAIKVANETGMSQKMTLKDGRIIDTSFKYVQLNPEWRDPKESKVKEIFYRLQKDFTERRTNGDKITWEDYINNRKDDTKKELDDFLQRLT